MKRGIEQKENLREPGRVFERQGTPGVRQQQWLLKQQPLERQSKRRTHKTLIKDNTISKVKKITSFFLKTIQKKTLSSRGNAVQIVIKNMVSKFPPPFPPNESKNRRENELNSRTFDHYLRGCFSNSLGGKGGQKLENTFDHYR